MEIVVVGMLVMERVEVIREGHEYGYAWRRLLWLVRVIYA